MGGALLLLYGWMFASGVIVVLFIDVSASAPVFLECYVIAVWGTFLVQSVTDVDVRGV